LAEAAEIAARHGWVRPGVYQGMYNAITRAVEPEFFKCLDNYGIRFHAYNPLAGGA
jgi:aflatoxin B1 aldehyde reductase